MTEKNYKIITCILLATNAICLITIGVLCGEIFTLQEKLSEMTDIIRALNDEISKIQAIQEETLLNQKETFLNEKRFEKFNGSTLIAAATILGIVVLMYFGGTGGIDRGLDLLKDKSSTDLINQTKLVGENLKLCLDLFDSTNEDFLKLLATKINTVTDKLDWIISTISRKS